MGSSARGWIWAGDDGEPTASLVPPSLVWPLETRFCSTALAALAWVEGEPTAVPKTSC